MNIVYEGMYVHVFMLTRTHAKASGGLYLPLPPSTRGFFTQLKPGFVLGLLASDLGVTDTCIHVQHVAWLVRI